VNDDAAVCSNSFAFNETSKVKSFRCTAVEPSLATNLLVEDSVLVQCFTELTAGNSADEGMSERANANSSSCIIQFDLSVTKPKSSVVCEATGCDVSPGNNNVACKSIDCKCGDDVCAADGTCCDCQPSSVQNDPFVSFYYSNDLLLMQQPLLISLKEIREKQPGLVMTREIAHWESQTSSLVRLV